MKEKIEQLLKQAVQSLKYPEEMVVMVERTRHKNQGDFASNLALLLAKALKQQPRVVAEQIVQALSAADFIEKIEIAGPGFINFYVKSTALMVIVERILNQGDQYGCSLFGKKQKILIEFVSANPTGPLHVGHGRGAAIGASLANILKAAGFDVSKEYYVNDAGRQMDILGLSLWLRYLQQLGAEFPMPANTYLGEYVTEIAKKFVGTNGRLSLPHFKIEKREDEGYVDELIAQAKSLLGQEKFSEIRVFAERAILGDIREDLAEFNVTFDQWFSEASLNVQQGLDELQKAGHLYEQDGAIWFKSSAFGDEKDRVVQRSNGEKTYFAADVAYHLNKLQRGFDTLIDIVGADHHGYAARMTASLKALDFPDRLKFILVQFAVLYRGKEKISMSTRSGQFVTLRELREEVGNDAARFFYALRKSAQHMDFDLELAKSQSHENPVYTIQYAHARVCSVFRKLAEAGQTYEPEIALQNLHLLTTDAERSLLEKLTQYPEMIEASVHAYEPHHLAHYLVDLAGLFHSYYNDNRVIVDDFLLKQARLALSLATRQVIYNGLTLLGVTAPEKM